MRKWMFGFGFLWGLAKACAVRLHSPGPLWQGNRQGARTRGALGPGARSEAGTAVKGSGLRARPSPGNGPDATRGKNVPSERSERSGAENSPELGRRGGSAELGPGRSRAARTRAGGGGGDPGESPAGTLGAPKDLQPPALPERRELWAFVLPVWSSSAFRTDRPWHGLPEIPATPVCSCLLPSMAPTGFQDGS
uniref:protein FAM167A isoform X3 n=1 Tax=Callithrix jacchus TaxID=9483 RepID=UPI0023DD29B1|nr:protein FAM167A isoform X3 [Callithrix jacchus]